ncbi:MAG: NADP-dependent oxidoreductase, partial [Proteobacteria bacterium]|nr:NADP-dependent oxidoreductase [Pseudomonadota bacterium]
ALIEWADIQAGQRVLVHAAAGGVGHIAVQIAKWKGCEVLGTASARNTAFLEGLGVDQVIDYTQTDFATAAQDVDVVFHTLDAGLRAKSWQTLKTGGKLVSITGPINDGEAEEYGCTGKFVMVRPSGSQLSEIGALIDAGTIKPIVDKVFPLSETAKAHDYVEAGHTRGKVVVEI